MTGLTIPKACAAAFLVAVYIMSAPDRSPAQDATAVPGTLAASTGDSVVAAPIAAPINSEADSVTYIPQKMMIFHGNEKKLAKITYQDMTLEALKITWYLAGDSLVAEGGTVPADPDSFPGGYRTAGQPVFTQQSQNPLTGNRMTYNLRTKKARILGGRTEYQNGYYFGQNITRSETSMLQIKEGKFTTCDKSKPDYYFQGKKMKVKIGDKVVASPVVFYIQDIPLMVLPFGIFPNKGGRTSGFIIPSYGESKREGRYLQGGGYYFAPNDYIDAKILMDFYEKSGILLRGDSRYNVRYKLSGTVSGSITRKNFDKRAERRWDLRVTHNQIINPTTKLSVSGNFVSDGSFYRDRSINRQERARQRIYSSANLTKRWEGSKNSLTVNASRELDLSNDNVTEVLPSLRFNRSTPTYLFRREGQRPGSRKNERFYSNLSFRYNSRLENIRRKRRFDTGLVDTVAVGQDTLVNPVYDFERTTRSGVQHNLGFSMPMTLLRYFSVNPSVNYKEEWFNEAVRTFLNEDDEVVTEKENGFFTRRTGNMSVSMNTKIYGNFTPKIGRLTAVRHVMTPSISFSYTPDFTSSRFGYFDSYIDTSGSEVIYDRFQGSLFGGTPRGESKSMSISLQNLFQAKTLSEDGETENKFDFLNIRSSTSYNFNAPPTSNKLSDLSSTIRLMHFAKLTLNTRHSFYGWDSERNRPSNTFLYKSADPWRIDKFIRLTSVSTSTSFRLQSKKPGTQAQPGRQASPAQNLFNDEEAVAKTAQADPQDRFTDRDLLTQQTIPWDLQMGFQFRLNRRNPARTRKTITSNARFNVNVTKNWRVGYRGQFDLVERSITSQDISVYRDLHCWEFQFSWTPPSSSRSGFWLEIRVKEPRLRDLRIKKTEYGGSAIFR